LQAAFLSNAASLIFGARQEFDLHRERRNRKDGIDQQEAVALMLEKYEICFGLFHGFDWSKWVTGTCRSPK